MDTYISDSEGIHYEVNGRTARGRIEGNTLYIDRLEEIDPVGTKWGNGTHRCTS